jgi:hypothetical protein
MFGDLADVLVALCPSGTAELPVTDEEPACSDRTFASNSGGSTQHRPPTGNEVCAPRERLCGAFPICPDAGARC